MNKRKGFTLMELTIVLGLLAILAAILVPLFLRTTDRARLRSDIQSARVIQNAMDLYRLERGTAVGGNNMDEKINNLVEAYYLNRRDARPQTYRAVWYEYRGQVRVNLTSVTDTNVRAVAKNLSLDERPMVIGITFP